MSKQTTKGPSPEAWALAEFAFRCAEKGMNWELTQQKIAEMWAEPSPKPLHSVDDCVCEGWRTK